MSEQKPCCVCGTTERAGIESGGLRTCWPCTRLSSEELELIEERRSLRSQLAEARAREAQLRAAVERIQDVDLDAWADIGRCECYDGGSDCSCSEEARRVTLRDAIRSALSSPSPALEAVRHAMNQLEHLLEAECHGEMAATAEEALSALRSAF